MLRMRQHYRNYIICGNVYEYVILGKVCENCIWYSGRYYFMAFWACGGFFSLSVYAYFKYIQGGFLKGTTMFMAFAVD